MSTMDRAVVPTSDPDVAAKADHVFAELQVVSRRLRRVHGLVGEVALLQDTGPWLDAGALCVAALEAVEAAASAVPEVAFLASGDPRHLVVGELRLDVPGHRAWFASRELSLPRQEFRLLAALAGAPTKVWSKQELLRDVWGFRASGRTRTLDAHASRVRRKLIDAGAQKEQWIINVWSVGYALLRPS